LFKGDIPGNSSVFIVGGSDDDLHEITAGGDTAFSLSGVGLTNAAGTDALPNLVAIRNQ